MELRTLRYFLAVAYEGNISRAAESLYIAQPSLSRQIQSLEKELGCQLFVRKSHRVELTPEGLELRSRASEVLDMVDRIEDEFAHRDEHAIAGNVHIVAAECAGVRLVSEVVACVRAQHPDIAFHLHTGDDEQASDMLDKGLADFAVICQPANLINYHTRELPHKDVWGVLMRADDPLAAHDAVTAAQLAKRTAYLSRQQVSLSHETNPFRNWLGRYRGRLEQAGTLDLVRNAGAMVAAGDALAVTFEGVGGYDTDDLVFRPFEPRLETTSVFAWKRHRTFSEASEVFLESMEARLEEGSA
ncbi:MAG: LysR family transcriptional regulator [Atopobiaceae bacterium]|nr:LysR family transcriptional regulator [Atopobiaceae bacterium]